MKEGRVNAVFTLRPIFVMLLADNLDPGGSFRPLMRKQVLRSLLILGFCQFGREANSQNTTPPPHPSEIRLKPITVGYTTLGGLEYSTADTPYLTNKELEELIGPLRDFESSRLLNVSESAGTKSTVFGSVGVLGLATGIVGLLATHGGQQTPFWITAAGGGITFEIGQLFRSESETAKFNCVQRYNRFARGEEQILPKPPEDEKSLLDFNKSGTSPGTGKADKAVP
jgi:hypothetical protein